MKNRILSLSVLVSLAVFAVGCGDSPTVAPKIKKAVQIVNGKWAFHHFVCADRSIGTFRSKSFPNLVVTYSFEDHLKGEIEVIRDFDQATDNPSGAYGNSGSYSRGNNVAYGAYGQSAPSISPGESLVTTMPLQLQYSDTLAVTLLDSATCQSKAGSSRKCDLWTSEVQGRKQFEFVGIPSLDKDTLTINGTFEPSSFVNCGSEQNPLPAVQLVFLKK